LRPTAILGIEGCVVGIRHSKRTGRTELALG